MNEIMMFEKIFTYFSVPIFKQVDGIILNVDHTILGLKKTAGQILGNDMLTATITLIIVLPISGLNRPFCTQRKYLTL